PDGPQDVPVQAQPNARSGTGAGDLRVALPRTLQHHAGATQDVVGTWSRHGATYSQQKAELRDLKVACPEYADINIQVLQDVLLRVEHTYQAFFRRVQADQAPGYPCFQDRDRYHCVTYPQVGDPWGARMVNGCLVPSKSGHLAVRWSRPLAGMPKMVTISRE